MNRLHHWLCRSAVWRRAVEHHLPWVLADLDLGKNVLEVGPGPGITTDLLRPRVGHLTCVEADGPLAAALSRRLTGTNVHVLHQDATAMTLPAGTFDAAVCFTMLHHVPSPALQDRLLVEVARVLRPGGIFAGLDSLVSPAFRLLHLFDTLTPIDPRTFGARLEASGFVDAHVEVRESRFRFRARRPPV